MKEFTLISGAQRWEYKYMHINNDEKLVGRNDYYLVEKVEDTSTGIKSITTKSFVERGKVLANQDDDFKQDTEILYLADYAIQIKGNTYSVKKDFIIATVLK